jgi:hypothetical protein
MTLVLRGARSSLVVLMVAAAVAACGEDADPRAVDGDGDEGDEDGGGGEGAIADECNPLGGATCLMPWPSSAYLEADESTATGFRVGLPIEGMPKNGDNIVVDPAPWNRFDGFSPSGAMLAAFEGGVSADGLPSHTDPAASLAGDSPVVVLNMDTGDRALVFAEVDMNVEDETLRPLIIRPLERLAAGARYAVGAASAPPTVGRSSARPGSRRCSTATSSIIRATLDWPSAATRCCPRSRQMECRATTSSWPGISSPRRTTA